MPVPIVTPMITASILKSISNSAEEMKTVFRDILEKEKSSDLGLNE